MLLGHNKINKFYALLSSHESTNIKTGQRIINKQIMHIQLELNAEKSKINERKTLRWPRVLGVQSGVNYDY